MNGFTAAAQLIQRAGQNGFFIEYVCLAASVIDGLLRIGLILNYQLETKTRDILDSLLYQSNEDKIIPERKIYKMALEKGILSQDLFDQLEDFYKKRNRVVHRYIISDITTDQVLNIGIQYEQIISSISNAVKILEDKQMETGIGMTRPGKDTSKEELNELLNKMSSKKHGSTTLNQVLKKQ